MASSSSKGEDIVLMRWYSVTVFGKCMKHFRPIGYNK